MTAPAASPFRSDAANDSAFINADRSAYGSDKSDDAGHAPLSDESDGADNGDYTGVHKILTNVDYWFNVELNQIDKEANRYANEWALQNIPGLTERRDELLPPEKDLVSRCESLWKQWPHRMKVKVQEAIDRGGDELAKAVSEGRAAVTEAKVAGDELQDAEKKIEEIRRATERETPKVQYMAFMRKPLWVFLTVVLVCVEFVANQPVFRIIWPMSRMVQRSADEAMEGAATNGVWAGLSLTGTEIMMHVEATVLALAVVIMLFVLAKELGVALRALTALRPEDHPFSASSIRTLHRQKWLVSIVTGLSVLFIVGFLFMARSKATNVVESRLVGARALTKAVEAGLDSVQVAGPSRADEILIYAGRLTEAREDVERKSELLAFARTVQDNNLGILILNFAFVGAALIVGFLGDARDMTETRGEHPDLPHLKTKCLSCRERLRRFTDQARDAVRQGDGAISRVNSLLRSKPLATLEAKRSRLLAMIPRWRGENARLRGLDPSHILAFQQPIALELGDIEESVILTPPETLGVSRQELDRLRSEANRVERIADGLDLKAAA